MKNIIKTYIWPFVAGASIVLSILSFFFQIFENDTYVKIALVTLVLFLIALLFIIVNSINKVFGLHFKDDYRRVSSFFVYEENVKGKSIFETYRLIQCKKIMLTEVPYKYKWTGKKAKICSKNQKITREKKGRDGEWDEVSLKFDKPLHFNDSTVLHIRTENEDPNGVAKPWIECRLESPIEFLHFRVQLAYKGNQCQELAVFERKRINSELDTGFEEIESIKFDATYMQYSYIYLNPDPGYYYRLRWQK